MTAAHLPWGQPVDRLGLTLLHFLRQATVISMFYAVLRLLLGTRCNPNLRYLLACSAMAGMMVAPMFTFAVLSPVESTKATGPTAQVPIVPGLAGVGTRLALPVVTSIKATRESTLTWVVSLWFAGSLALSLRLIGGWFSAERTSSAHVRAAPVEWRRVFTRLSCRMGVLRPIRLMVSVQVHAPTVIGWIRASCICAANREKRTEASFAHRGQLHRP
ncbi:MAG TPA: hypothetical protein VE422_43740 [Terriglobia bacterium]|nr:hypothetical protein [Terriglobia bacterium]